MKIPLLEIGAVCLMGLTVIEGPRMLSCSAPIRTFDTQTYKTLDGGRQEIDRCGIDFLESRSYDPQGRLYHKRFVDPIFRIHTVCYDPETGVQLKHEIQE